MKIVITGGIGSGKSTVAKLLADKLGYKLYSFDRLVDQLYEDASIAGELYQEFGTSDRKSISAIVFQDGSDMTKLEKIFAPYLISSLADILKNDNIIFEIPLLFEKLEDYIPEFDMVISVIVNETIRIDRAMRRDNCAPSVVLQKIRRQTTDEQRLLRSDLVIYNNFSEAQLESDIEKLVQVRFLEKPEPAQADMATKKVGIVSGSFDPITLGHTWIIQRALDIVDHVIIAVAHNPTKKYLLSKEDRVMLVSMSLVEVLTKEQCARVTIDLIPSDELIVTYAKDHNAKFIFRGIRNSTDLEYENQLNLLQKKIAPDVETVFLLTPRELIEISSSLIKNVLGLREWERVAGPYVTNCVLKKLKDVAHK